MPELINRFLLVPKYMLVLATSLVLSCAVAHAQAPSLVESEAQSLRIKDIVINGLRRTEPLNVLYQIGISAGDDYDENAINEALKTLMATQLFDDVSFEMSEGILVIDIVEAPIINRINFEGNSEIEDKNLSDEVSISPRQPLNQAKVAQAVRHLLEIYQAAGFFHTIIQPKVIHLEQNRVDLIFDVEEGVKGTIRSIRFLGNEVFPDSTLQGIVLSREGYWYIPRAKESYNPSRIAYDRELIRNFYLERGYLDFKIRDTIVGLHANQEDFLLTFDLEEGKRFHIRSATVNTRLEGHNLDEVKKLTAKRFKAGDPYSLNVVQTYIEEVKELVEEQDYYPVEVITNTITDDDEPLVDLSFSVDQGQKQIIRQINIIGNLRTRDNVIRRALYLEEGEIFRPENVEKSRRALLGLDYFKNINFEVQASDRAPNQIVIDLIVEEKSTGSIKFGAGYNTSFGLQGTITFTENNLIGYGYQLDANITLAERFQNFSVSFTDPRFLDLPLSLGGDLYHSTTTSNTSSFNSLQQGGRARVGYPLGSQFYQSFRLEVTNKEVTSNQALVSPYLASSLGKFSQVGLGHTIRFEEIDNPQRPHAGFKSSLDFDVFGFEETKFFVTKFDSNGYVPVTTNSTLLIKNTVGYVHSLHKDKPVNITNRFFAGGSALPRGFAASGVGPRDERSRASLGGNFMWTGTFEYEFPFGVPLDLGVFATAFVDAGIILFNDDTVIPGHPILSKSIVRSSGGFGLRWYSPFAPITLSFAWPISKASHDITQVFDFSLSVGN